MERTLQWAGGAVLRGLRSGLHESHSVVCRLGQCTTLVHLDDTHEHIHERM